MAAVVPPSRARLHVVVTSTVQQAGAATRAVRAVADQLGPRDAITLLLHGPGTLPAAVTAALPWSGGRPCVATGATVQLSSLPVDDEWGYAARNAYGHVAAEDSDYVWHLRASTIVRAGAVAVVKVAIGDDRAGTHVFRSRTAAGYIMPSAPKSAVGHVDLVNGVVPSRAAAATPFGLSYTGDGQFYEALVRSGVVEKFHNDVVADV